MIKIRLKSVRGILKHFSGLLPRQSLRGNKARLLVFTATFAAIGTILLFATRAAGPFASLEPEQGAKTAAVNLVTDSTASGGSAVKFGICSPLESAGCTGTNSDGTFFRETFNGGPSAPIAISNNLNRWFAFPFLGAAGGIFAPMAAQHGSDCLPPPANHNINSTSDSVFLCKDHLMTAIDCCGDGHGADAQVTLQPNHLIDLSQGEAVIRIDVSTLSPSAGDWWEIWITPWDDQLVAPANHFFHETGAPKTAIMLDVTDFSPESKNWGHHFWNDFNLLVDKQAGGSQNDPSPAVNIRPFVSVSDTRRDTYELRITKNKVKKLVKNSSTGQMTQVDEFDIPGGFPANEAVVQFLQSNYRTRENGAIPCGGCVTSPATWHWDNAEIYPAIPYKMIGSNEMSAVQTSPESLSQKITFKEPAPANARMLFRGWDFNNQPKVSFDNGASWQIASAVRPPNDYGPLGFGGVPDLLTYSIPVPSGMTSVLMNGNGNCFDGTCADRLYAWAFDGFHVIAR